MRYHQLLETLTTGEFTFGFELEAIFTSDSKDLVQSKTVDNDTLYGPTQKGLDYILSSIQKLGFDGKIVEDTSIRPGIPNSFGFEFVSTPLSFNTNVLSNMIKMLSNLKNYGITTNESCGFHIHTKYPKLSINDMRWVVASISQNDSYKDHVSQMNEYDFYDLDYANTSFLDKIDNAITDHNDEELKDLLDDTKYRVIRIHPQGTLEWRGPRNFLNSGSVSDIKMFITHLYGYLRIIISCLSKPKVGDYTRMDFDNLFSDKTEFDSLEKKKLNKLLRHFDTSDYKFVVKAARSNKWLLDVKIDGIASLIPKNDHYLFNGDISNCQWYASNIRYYSGNIKNVNIRMSNGKDAGVYDGTYKDGKLLLSFQ